MRPWREGGEEKEREDGKEGKVGRVQARNKAQWIQVLSMQVRGSEFKSLEPTEKVFTYYEPL